MKIPKKFSEIKNFNLELISKNFGLQKSEISLLKESLKCEGSTCGDFNKKAIKEIDFIYCYLPLPKPKLGLNQKVTDFFICKEPSTGWVKGNQNNAWSKVNEHNIINFIGNDIKLKKLQVLFISYFNVFPEGKFYITDLSKCAMNVKHNKIEALNRYKCCQSLLELEINKYTDSSTRFYLVGDNKEDTYVSLRKFIKERTITPLPHYAIQISCPDFINDMYFYARGTDENEILKEIFLGYNQLGEKLSNNFNLPFIPNLIKKESVPPTNILLYSIYKSCFERSK